MLSAPVCRNKRLAACQSRVPAKRHTKAAGNGEMLGDNSRRNLVHVRAAVLLRDIHIGDADFTRLLDQPARHRELLMLNLVRVGQNLIAGKILRGLRDLLVLFAQVFQR